ncbi:MAG: hypothetical protein RBS17_11555 [Coriobacteriia bacterium]|nr:hypothetical protein [Coriobacteriia bacterium]
MSQSDPSCPVYVGGSQRGMLGGDITAHVRVADLLDHPHLYAVGPGEGVRGEITVFDSRAYLTRIDGFGEWCVTEISDGGACFLVWSYVSEWVECAPSQPLSDLTDLEAALPVLAREAGLPETGPIPFLVEARPSSISLHALHKPDDSPHSLQGHHASKVPAKIEGRSVRFVGFFAQKGHGAFTPPDSTVHCHVCTVDDSKRICGHVDAVCFSGDSVRLFLPARCSGTLDAHGSSSQVGDSGGSDE